MLQRFLYTAKVGVHQYRKHGRTIIGGGLEYGVWRHLVILPFFFYRNKGVVAVSCYRRETTPNKKFLYTNLTRAGGGRGEGDGRKYLHSRFPPVKVQTLIDWKIVYSFFTNIDVNFLYTFWRVKCISFIMK